ncbi:MAG: hypothetical protein JWN98_2753, partial [Abditibacteriota bacterium]|nr:hypothetical protein [Abditibacteriota bacterium]
MKWNGITRCLCANKGPAGWAIGLVLAGQGLQATRAPASAAPTASGRAGVPIVPTSVTKIARVTGKSRPGETLPNPN